MGFWDRFSAIGRSAFSEKKQKKTEQKVREKEKKEKVKEKEKKADYETLKPKVEDAPTVSVKEKGAKESKKKKADTKEAYRILIKPLVTEKATDLANFNKYCFEVAKNANKIAIKKAIKSLYGVEPIDVNIINMRGKKVSYGRVSGKRKNWKKAIVTLKEGDKIEIYEGV